VNDQYEQYPIITDFCKELRSKDNLSPHLLSLLADIYQGEGKKEDATQVRFIFIIFIFILKFQN